MNDFTIRPATAQDAEHVQAIAREAWGPIYAGYRDQLGDELFDLFFPDAIEKKVEAVRCNVESGTCYVTELRGRIVGFIHYIYSEETRLASISHNAVLGEMRGHGIAARQYDFVFDVLRKRGAVGVRVQTGLDDAHAPARRAYGKAGFLKSTEAVTYYKKL